MLEDRRLGFALGAVDYVTKPVEPGHLADLLHRLAPEPDTTVLFVEGDAGGDDLAEGLRGIIHSGEVSS